MASVIDRVEAMARPILDDLGVELYDLEMAGGVLKITIDKPGGVDLEDIGDVTRMVSRELDHTDPIPATYTLEVTSPGLERVLRTPAHFAKAIGMTVNVKLVAGADGDRRVQGVLMSCNDGEIVVRVDGERTIDERPILIDQIDKARTVFVWGGQPKPGGPKKRPKSAASASRGANDEAKETV